MSADPDRIPDALLRPVRLGNAFEETVARLLSTIRLGVIRPGEQFLPERELAVRLGVSRDTVRDALKSLSDAGYVVSRRGRYGGTFLAERLPAPTDGGARVTRAEIDDLLRLREILEVGAVRMAAARELSVDENTVLWARVDEVCGAGPEDYRRLDSRLHLAMAEAAGSPSLVPLVAENRMRVNVLLDRIPLLQRNIEHSNERHEVIVAAITAGEPERAATAMLDHLAGSATLLHGFLD